MRAAAAEIGLDGLSASAQAAKIRRFFLDNFKYSLIQPGVYRRQPLQNFLQRTRRGHCEYFATAAVLLARHVGIPARYTVGYSVESYSPLERAYIARARHAHSWALVYVDGAWVVLDATPAVWFELEEDYASQWQTLQDLMTWLWYRYQRLNQADFSELQSWLIYLVPPLAIILYVRLRRSPAARKQSQRDDGASYHDPVDRDAALHRTVMHLRRSRLAAGAGRIPVDVPAPLRAERERWRAAQGSAHPLLPTALFPFRAVRPRPARAGAQSGTLSRRVSAISARALGVAARRSSSDWTWLM